MSANKLRGPRFEGSGLVNFHKGSLFIEESSKLVVTERTSEKLEIHRNSDWLRKCKRHFKAGPLLVTTCNILDKVNFDILIAVSPIEF